MSAKTRLWVLGAGVVSAALILFGIIGGLLPQLAIASSTDDLAESAQIRNDAQVVQIQMLQQAEKNRAELEAVATELSGSLPATVASAELLRELETLALQSGVQLTSVTASSPVPPEVDPEAAAAEAAAAAAADTAGDGAGAEAANAAEPAPAPAAGLTAIPLNVVAAGAPEALANFARALQTGQRLILVKQLDIVEGSEGASTATLDGLIFIAAS
ncbi:MULTISPECIES: GspMb/PilO family protein [unclassified Leucobacter]|uniref:GspMb/PilO family protein n=1 Tax=unclassified Leucobacter TaxID=2621730 RepID=UPI00165DE9B0|nr:MULTISPECIES: GspMb/PilO family protein [unclassified Leucobacter]MBC9925918.1 hypothetical protein [Leucobacter sp. cx-169]MBC9935571.1 hypothetical protein [Leucobacter sp. cx-87]